MTTKTLIEVKGLEKHFGQGTVRALNGVDAEIKQGEKLVVIGPSGSGKSTFLRCLNRLEEPTGGHIFFDGVDITVEGLRHRPDAPPHGHGVPAVQSLPAHDRACENITLGAACCTAS